MHDGTREYSFDGLVGTTHSYGGLSRGKPRRGVVV